jgi:uncharacterized protein
VRAPVVALLVLALAAGCGGDEGTVVTAAETARPATDASETTAGTGSAELEFEEGHVLIRKRGGGEPASVIVEIAEKPEQHQMGLMFREVLPPDHGMIFVFDEEQTGGFWMKNTLLPLSIAFYGENGRILKILDMEPCTADPCPSYDPEVAYVGALEVNQGAFARWGVEPGDRIVLHRL